LEPNLYLYRLTKYSEQFGEIFGTFGISNFKGEIEQKISQSKIFPNYGRLGRGDYGA